jgi:hypothetical protein
MMTTKSIGKSLVRTFVLMVAVCTLFSFSFASQPAENQVKPALSSLAFFLGDWECSGKFDSSGKSIDASQHFTSELDGSWILFRHDDKPPFNYHSLAEWGWDSAAKNFVMIAQDSTGGVRVFRSNGWDSLFASRRLQWEGDTLGSASAPSQQFTFERLDDRHYRVSYSVRKSADWSRVDSSTCSKQ